MIGIRGHAAGLVMALAGAGILPGWSGRAAAQGGAPPIQSPQDAACRNEARAKVFVTPDPKGLGLYGIGRQIHAACMQRLQPAAIRRVRNRTR